MVLLLSSVLMRLVESEVKYNLYPVGLLVPIVTVRSLVSNGSVAGFKFRLISLEETDKVMDGRILTLVPMVVAKTGVAINVPAIIVAIYNICFFIGTSLCYLYLCGAN